MTFDWVHMVASEGTGAHLGPGDLIGRSWRAELSIVDPSVSEFHASVSLRSGRIQLRKLGGPLSVHGMAVTEVVAEPGLRIELSATVSVEVVAVQLPERLCAIVIDGGKPQPLLGSRHALTSSGQISTFVESGGAVVWTDGDRWFVSDGDDITVLGYERLHWREHRLELVDVCIDQGEVLPTRRLECYAPIRITTHYSTVQIHQEGQPVLVLSGQPAYLVTEVAKLGPAPWYVVAGELWPRLSDRIALRKRWDRVLARVRQKLRAGGLREDLLCASGGQIQLVTLPGDHIEICD